MPKWLSNTLLVLLALILFAGALYGAFSLGRSAGNDSSSIREPSEFFPRLDRDQVKPNLRDQDMPYWPWMHMPDGVFSVSRLPVIGFFLAALWALFRLGLLVLLIWLVVRLVLRNIQPAPPTPPSSNNPPQD